MRHILLLCSILCFGCGPQIVSQRAKIGDFTALSTKSVAYNYDGVKQVTGKAGRVYKTDCYGQRTLVSSDVSDGDGLMKLAVKEALENAGPGYNLLVDVVIYKIIRQDFEGIEVEGLATKSIQGNTIINNATNNIQ